MLLASASVGRAADPAPSASNLSFFVTLQPIAVIFDGKGGSCPDRT
jgi:hypothetical protein